MMRSFLGSGVVFLAFVICVSLTANAQPRPSARPNSKPNSLMGTWEATEDGFTVRLVFRSATELEIEGEPGTYELTPTTIRVKDSEGMVEYGYALSGDVLVLTYEEGDQVTFHRAGGNVPTGAIVQKEEEQVERTARDEGKENHLLVGKFMSYSSASSSTGSSSWTMYVTFDGQGGFEWSSESEHSARQYDQTGAQTGSGLAYGTSGGNRGTYRVEGNKIIATFPDGTVGEAMVTERFQDGSIGAFTYDGKTYAR